MIKRAFDLFFSVAFLIPLAPLLLPLAILLRLTGEREVFYFQERVGKGGRIFKLAKFATMLKDSPQLPGGDVTMGSRDPRILPVGGLLRKTKINEIPQLINILKGDISVVGPRPLTPRNFEYYPKDIKDIIKQMQPGLTGVGSIIFRNEEAIIEKSSKDALTCYEMDIAPYKGRLEVWYYENRSLLLDFKVVFLTGWVVLFRESMLHRKVLNNLPPPPVGLFEE